MMTIVRKKPNEKIQMRNGKKVAAGVAVEDAGPAAILEKRLPTSGSG